MRLRVIVTGYGDFAGTWDEAAGRPNPSSVLARALSASGLANARVERRELEVTHAAVEAFIAEVRENPPDIVLSLGVSPKAQVEERPENWKSDAIDGRGQRIEPGPISAREEPRVRLTTMLPVHAIEEALRRAERDGTLASRTVATSLGPEGSYAPDASSYLCNYLNYRLTGTFGAVEGITAGFVHVTAQTTVDEIRIIAQALVDHVTAPPLHARRKEILRAVEGVREKVTHAHDDLGMAKAAPVLTQRWVDRRRLLFAEDALTVLETALAEETLDGRVLAEALHGLLHRAKELAPGHGIETAARAIFEALAEGDPEAPEPH